MTLSLFTFTYIVCSLLYSAWHKLYGTVLSKNLDISRLVKVIYKPHGGEKSSAQFKTRYYDLSDWEMSSLSTCWPERHMSSTCFCVLWKWLTCFPKSSEAYSFSLSLSLYLTFPPIVLLKIELHTKTDLWIHKKKQSKIKQGFQIPTSK